MRKDDLVELTIEIKAVTKEPPIIVGSQALYSITTTPPDIVRRSVECDFLLIGNQSSVRQKVNQDFGVFSSYQQDNGFYADALGLATVVLPEDWQERLIPLKDDNNIVIALYAEIHDVAVSKLIAGREKDFEFLIVAFRADYIDSKTFIERARTITSLPQHAALEPRLKSFGEYLKRHNDLRDVYELIEKLRREIQRDTT